jgi:hypothetical protein
VNRASARDRGVRSAAARLNLSPEQYADIINSGNRFCGGCRRTLPATTDHFPTDGKSLDGLRSRCRGCVSSAKKQHYDRTRDAARAKRIAYQREHRARLYAYNAQWQRARQKRLRLEAIAAYGAACACCGEREPIFLDLDHVHDNGRSHREEVGNNTQMMIQLRKAGWPKGFIQLLCCNCNQGKARNGGVCPHVANR